MFRIFAIVILSFSCAFLNAQAVGDYQSVASGNWNALATWQTWNGVAWVAAGATPTSANGTITIQSPNVVTVTAAVTVDQVVINSGATLQNTAAIVITINNSGVVASEFIINGTFIENGNASVAWGAGATWSFGPTGTYIKTGNTSAANWQSFYDGGIATIPATSTWINRKIAAANPPLITIGAYYGNLTIENNVAGIWNTATTSTFQGVGGNPIIKGNFDIGGAGTSTVNFLNQHTSAQPTQVLGNVLVRLGNILANNGTGLEIQGNLTVTGSLTYGAANSRRLDFTGGNAQSVSGAGTLNVFNCTLNKTGNSVTLNRAMTVDNLMTFTSGIINTTSVNLLTINTNGSVAGANNLSFVNGPCRYTGSAAFTFPVGKNADYQALSYNATPGAGGIFWTETFNNGCVNACTANGVNTGNGAWSIDNSNNPALDNCGTVPQHNVWYVSCKENGNAAGTCGTGCAANATLHIGSTTLGDQGASFDAGGYCDVLGGGFGGGTNTNTMAVSPTISTIGQTNITLSFNYLLHGAIGHDWGWVDYSTNNGATWTTLANPLPQTTCCGGPCDNAHQGLWTNYSTVLPVAAENIAGFKIRFGWINDDDGAGTDPSFAINDITLSTPANPVDFTCEYFYANPQVVYNNVLAPTLNAIDGCEYWTLTRNAGTANKIITLTWDGNTCPVIPLITDTRVAHFDLTMWQNEGNGGNTGTVAAGTVTSAAAVTYYGPFTIGLIPPTPLPIEMTQFDGECNAGKVKLTWTTATEKNNDFFAVERSVDGLTFSQLGIVDGAGNSDQPLHYSFVDTDPVGGTNYYRIKQTDFNGAFSYNRIIAVNVADCDNRNLSVTNVLFNSADLEIDYIHGKAPVTIEVYSVDGRLIKQVKQLPVESNYHLDTSDWSSSIYFIRVTDGISSITKTIQK